MPRIFQIADDFADRFAFERSRVSGIAKALRDDGLLKAGPRGVNAPDATPLDAARILIAMMLRVKHHEAPEAVRLFGQLRTGDRMPVGLANKDVATFEEAIAALIAYYGRPAPDMASAYAYFGRFNADVSIVRAYCHGRVFLERFADEDEGGHYTEQADEDGIAETREFLFIHPDIHVSADTDEVKVAESVWDDVRKYRTGFHEIPRLFDSDLLAIGQILTGQKPLGWQCRSWTEVIAE